jgi:hypothetical protein
LPQNGSPLSAVSVSPPERNFDKNEWNSVTACFRRGEFCLVSSLAISVLFHLALISLPLIGGGHTLPGKYVATTNRHLSTELSITFREASHNVAPVSESTDLVAETIASPVEIPPQNIALKDGEVSSPSDKDPVGNILPIPTSIYYTTDQLTKHPQAIEMAELDAPEVRPFKVSGRIVLKLWIDSQGRVANAVVEDTELPTIFSKVAVDAFMHSRFTPGERDGVKVGTVMRIEVGYEDKSLPLRPVPSATEN